MFVAVSESDGFTVAPVKVTSGKAPMDTSGAESGVHFIGASVSMTADSAEERGAAAARCSFGVLVGAVAAACPALGEFSISAQEGAAGGAALPVVMVTARATLACGPTICLV